MHLSYEQRKVREIEYDSEFAFLSGLSLLFGVGFQSEIDTINRNMNRAFAFCCSCSKTGCRPSKRTPKYIELDCKILLSLENGAILLVEF